MEQFLVFLRVAVLCRFYCTVISFSDQLKHWQVISVQGGTVMAGTRLYLGCTKFALVLLQDYRLIAFHDLTENKFGLCYENDNILHLSVTRISQSEDDLEQSSKYHFLPENLVWF